MAVIAPPLPPLASPLCSDGLRLITAALQKHLFLPWNKPVLLSAPRSSSYSCFLQLSVYHMNLGTVMGEMPVMVSICTQVSEALIFATHQEQRMLCCVSYADLTLIRRNVTTSDRWVTLMISSSWLLPKIRMRNENFSYFSRWWVSRKNGLDRHFLPINSFRRQKPREQTPPMAQSPSFYVS